MAILPIRNKRLAAGLAVLLLLGCSGGTAEQHYARAQSHVERGESSAAVIELRNALQKEPKFAAARFLLGQLYADGGDFNAALREFERALDLGLDSAELRIGLLAAKVQLGRFQEVIGELEQEAPLDQALAVVLADAYAGNGDGPRAKALYQGALGLPGANLGLGVLSWREGDVAAAREYFDRALALAPDDLDVLLTKAEFELEQRDLEAATSAFQRAAAIPEGAALGRTGVAHVEVVKGDLQSASATVDLVLADDPKFVPARYLRGLIRYQSGELDAAAAAVQQVLDAVPAHLPSRYLLGAIEYRRGDREAARKHLQRYLEQKPDDESATKLLASVHADAGDFEAVRTLLEPLQRGTTDPQILAMYGSAQMRLGRQTEATAALERAVALAPDMAPFRNQLALSLLSSGETARAESELRTAIDVDGGQFQSDHLLALLQLRERNWDGALAAAAGLVAKNPQSPVGFNLEGAAYLGKGETETAKQRFRAALERDPSFLPAIEQLSRLAEREGDVARAESYYQDLLRSTPDHVGALLGLAELSVRQGRDDDALVLLERALMADPRSVPAGLGLGRLQLARGRTAEAAAAVEQALAAAPQQLDLQFLRAEIALRAGDAETARRIASNVQSRLGRLPDDAALLKQLGLLQANTGQPTLARLNLENSLKLRGEPDADVLRALVRLDIQDRNLGEARRRLDRLSRSGFAGPPLELLKADVLAAGGDERGALAIYRSLADRGVRDGVLRFAAATLQAGNPSSTVAVLEDWLARNPADDAARLLLAETLMRRGSQDQALALYEQLAGSGHPLALNNLAWLYMEKGDERAEATGRQALAAAPENPDVLDTLGWILQRQGATEEAVRLLRRSAELKPSDPTVAFHLGMALKASGDVDGARRSLRRALDGGAFAEADRARQALRELADSGA